MRSSAELPPDFLSHSHGEGFLRFFEERCQRQGLFIFDEPESALSPSRQIEFLKLLQMMDRSGAFQVIMATHSPMLMAYPNATLLRLTKYGLEPTTVKETDHYKTLREFFEIREGSWRRRSGSDKFVWASTEVELCACYRSRPFAEARVAGSQTQRQSSRPHIGVPPVG